MLEPAFDRSSAIQSRFRLSVARAIQLHNLLRYADVYDPECWFQLDDIDREIMSSIYWEMNQLSYDESFDEARAALIAPRSTWVFTRAAEEQVFWNGVLGYFGNRDSEAFAAVRAYRLLGAVVHADTLQEHIDAMPRRADGQIDWHRWPVPDDLFDRVKSDSDVLVHGAALERARYALCHPSLFFTASADHYQPPVRE